MKNNQMPFGVAFITIMLILLVAVVWSWGEEQHFKITEEVCEEQPSFTFNEKGQQLNITTTSENLGEIHVLTFKDFNSNMVFVEYNKCKQVEVDEITACCLELGESDSSDEVNLSANVGTMRDKNDYYNAIFCFPEDNLEYFEAPCEPLKKEDLKIEWLDWNSECVEGSYMFKEVLLNEGQLPIMNKWCREGLNSACEFLRQIECSKYKFGNFTIETWSQIK